MYWLPKLHKKPYKARFIANSSHCSLKNLSVQLTSALTEIREHLIKYSEVAYTNSGVNYFWSIKNSSSVLNKINNLNNISHLSTYDFSTLYTSLPHQQIKDKLKHLIKWTFAREGKMYLTTREGFAFFSHKIYNKNYKSWTCNELCDALTYLIDNIFVEFQDKIYRQIIGIPMGTNCAPLVADLFLYCHEKQFMDKLVKNKKLELIQCFNRTSRYLDDILNINNPYFDKYIPEIYPKELILIKANVSNNNAVFLDLHLSVVNNKIYSKIYDKRDDFGFPIVNFPWLDGDVPRAPCYGIYISQLVRFARACTEIADFHSRNLQLTTKLISQGYRYHKLRKTFGRFHKKYKELLLKYGNSVSYLDFVTQGISHPQFYGDLVLKVRKIYHSSNFFTSCKKIVKKLLHKRYDKAVLRQTLSMISGPFTTFDLDNFQQLTRTNDADGNG